MGEPFSSRLGAFAVIFVISAHRLKRLRGQITSEDLPWLID
jgi:hypothetical protein